jgi:hypothetical protein
MRQLKLLIGLMGLFLSLTVTNADVQACSGGGYQVGNYPLDYLLQGDLMLAMGRIEHVSTSGINVVLSVEHYLRQYQQQGTLLFVQEKVDVIHLVQDGRRYPSRCNYLSPPLEAGKLFLTTLRQQTDGTYQGEINLSDEAGIFNSWIIVGDQVSEVSFTYAELLAYVEQSLGTTSQLPEYHTPPRPVMLKITTDSGARYGLPVDGTALIELPLNDGLERCHMYMGCTLTWVEAPNGIDRVFFYPEHTEDFVSYDTFYSLVLAGEAAVFSQRSDLLAVWTGPTLRLWATAYQRELGTSDIAWQFTSHETPSDDPFLVGAGAWHPNGRTFAFSTAAGIWLWNLGSVDAVPELFLPASREPLYVRSYSALGTYLAVETGGERYHLDTLTGNRLPDGLLSPDERLLAAFDTSASALTPLSLYHLMPWFRAAPFWASYIPTITQLEWLNSNTFFFAACGDAFNYSEGDGFDQPWCKVFRYRVGVGSNFNIDGTAFDYDAVTDSLAVLVDGSSVNINGEHLTFAELSNDPITEINIVPLLDLDHRALRP